MTQPTPTPTFAELAQSYRNAAELLQRKDEIERAISDLKAEEKQVTRALRRLKTGDLKNKIDAAVAATPDPGPDPA